MEWKQAIDSFIEMFSNLDFSKGPLFYVIGIAIAFYCCMEGYRIYKMILGGLGFVLGFRLGLQIFTRLGFTGEELLMAETFLGLILMVIAYKIFLAGVFIAAFGFAASNLPVYVEAFLKERVEHVFPVTGFTVTAIAIVLSFITAKLAVKMTRPVLVCLTAVIGGFAAINFLILLIPVFPYELDFPPESSVVWLLAKLFLSAAGVGVQGVKDPA